jgi:HlyD family secretion protein
MSASLALLATITLPAVLPAGDGAVQPAAPGWQSAGYVVATHHIRVNPMVGGRIVAVCFKVGDKVGKGQVLARLDATEFEMEATIAKALLKQAKARYDELNAAASNDEVARAKAELDEASVALRQRQQELKRTEELSRKGAAPLADYTKAESEYHAYKARVERLTLVLRLLKQPPSKNRLDAAAGAVEEAEARVKRALWRLQAATVRAPCAGTILAGGAGVGANVNPVAFGDTGVICELADLTALEVAVDVPEKDLGRVLKGQQCAIQSDVFPKVVYRGRVERVLPLADRARGTVPVRVRLAPVVPPGQTLFPEMRVRVTFLPKQ